MAICTGLLTLREGLTAKKGSSAILENVNQPGKFSIVKIGGGGRNSKEEENAVGVGREWQGK